MHLLITNPLTITFLVPSVVYVLENCLAGKEGAHCWRLQLLLRKLALKYYWWIGYWSPPDNINLSMTLRWRCDWCSYRHSCHRKFARFSLDLLRHSTAANKVGYIPLLKEMACSLLLRYWWKAVIKDPDNSTWILLAIKYHTRTGWNIYPSKQSCWLSGSNRTMGSCLHKCTAGIKPLILGDMLHREWETNLVCDLQILMEHERGKSMQVDWE